MIDTDRNTVEWAVSRGYVEHPDAVAVMEERAAAIRHDQAPELIWLLEHPPLYTAGTSAREEDLRDPGRFPIFPTGRGGQYTYHGPGQRIAYVMLDVKRRFGTDVRAFIATLEAWIITSLGEFGVTGEIRCGRVGVWVVPPTSGEPERKIAAIGIRIRHGVSFHGVSLNVAPDLAHYEGIVPCGISDRGVTSLADLGRTATMEDVDHCLRRSFEQAFSAKTTLVPSPIAALEAQTPHG
ncbi:lipoyl(octanoyl) transferase LipB [Hyphomicrobium sp.]|uniref:lipoyl(octanoyl) transferase LipB n=1 Tax=Hyphomicrobium sp. TaxID=82 RepID=UPI002FDEDB29